MRREELEILVLDQKETLQKKEEGIPREVDYDKMVSTRQITVISGIRRSGKSTLMRQLMKRFPGCSYLNFDDERLINFTVSDFQTLLSVFSKYSKSNVLFFDEIQNVAGWERFVRRIYEEGYKIFITGSNAKLLSSELATHLTGRYIKTELLPFSFREILNYHNVTYETLSSSVINRILSLFDLYMEQGGFPDMVKFNDREYLTGIYEDILYKDLIVRYGIKNIRQFKNLSQLLFSNFTKHISYNSLKSALGIKSTTTVQQYISYLEESYLVFELYKYDYSLKKQFISNKKVYVIDNGIIKNISFQFSKDRGKYLENLVFLELLRRNKKLYFYKTSKNTEVDFIYETENGFDLIQVSYETDDLKTRRRELKAFADTIKEIPVNKCILLTYNDEETINEYGTEVNIIPVWKWMLR